MITRLLGWLIQLPRAPHRITAKAIEIYGWECAFTGAAIASFAWIALIIFSLIVAIQLRRNRP